MIDWEGLKVLGALRRETIAGKSLAETDLYIKACFDYQRALDEAFPAILAQHEADKKVIEAAKKLRSDFVTAIAMRESQCRNSDVENEGGNPLTWDKTLMKWSATLAEFDKVVKP